jgi:hypothetical protein
MLPQLHHYLSHPVLPKYGASSPDQRCDKNSSLFGPLRLVGGGGRGSSGIVT